MKKRNIRSEKMSSVIVLDSSDEDEVKWQQSVNKKEGDKSSTSNYTDKL